MVEVLQVLGQLLPGLGRKGRPPRPRYPGGEAGLAADVTSPDRRDSALFDRARLEDGGVSCRGRERAGPISEAWPGERGLPLLSCRPPWVAPFKEGDALPSTHGTRETRSEFSDPVRYVRCYCRALEATASRLWTTGCGRPIGHQRVHQRALRRTDDGRHGENRRDRRSRLPWRWRRLSSRRSADRRACVVRKRAAAQV